MKRKLMSVMIGASLMALPAGAALAQQKKTEAKPAVGSAVKLSDGVVKLGILTDLAGL